MEVDCMTEILLVAEATSCVFQPLDCGVERFTAGIRNLVSQVGDHRRF